MKEQVNNGKGFLKEKLGGYQVDPPDSVWNAISARMGGRSRRVTVITVLAAAASVALAITLGIHYFGREIPDEGTYAVAEPEPGRVEQAAEAGTEAAVQDREKSLEEKVVHAMENLTAEAEDLSAEAEDLSAEAEDLPAEAEDLSAEAKDLSAEAKDLPAEAEDLPAEVPDLSAEVPGLAAESPVLALNRSGETEQTNRAEEVSGSEEEGHAVKDENRADELQSRSEEEVPGVPAPEAGETLQEKMAMEFEEVARRDPRWIIGAAMSPLYTFRDAESGAMAGVPDHESGIVSYAGGIQVGYRTTRRLALESGVFFNKMGIAIGAAGIQLSRSEFAWAPLEADAGGARILAVANTVGNIVSMSGDIYVNSYKLNADYDANTVSSEFAGEEYAGQGIRQHLDYLEVPLNLRYTLVDRSIKVQLVGGLSTNLLVNNSVTMETAEGTSEIGYLTNIRNVNYSGNAGIGLSYYFLNRFSLSLEPRFRYFLNSVNDDTLPSTRPYTFGLYTGLSYLF